MAIMYKEKYEKKDNRYFGFIHDGRVGGVVWDFPKGREV